MDEAIQERIYDLFCRHGADIWFEMPTDDILPPGTVCKACGSADIVKETDILDVWFESGVSHAAVLEERPNLRWPADMYLEGSDQHRGWFHSSLLASVGTRGRAPYDSVLTHGFVVDADGKKMSKSLGNVIAPGQVIDKYGAEILRLWVAASDYREDVRISDQILSQLSDAYRRIRNTSRFILGNLYDFDPGKDAVPAVNDLDRFALHRLAMLVEKCRKAYETYDFHIVYHALYSFCTVDLSAFYLDICKDRLYVSPAASSQRRSAQTVMHHILEALTRLMAPIMPFTAEEIWGYLPATDRKEVSIHMAGLPAVAESWLDPDLGKRWNLLLGIRGEVTKALEEARSAKRIGNSLDAAVTVYAPSPLIQALLPLAGELWSLFIVSQVSLVEGQGPAQAFTSGAIEGLGIVVAPAKGPKCQRCWVHDPQVGTDAAHPDICPRCQAALAEIQAG
jgi:isoleucyl-tRNA synthetase